jgi:single-strand DNA-binding protein
MLNRITIMGRLTRDVELRRTGSGVAVASFTLAVDRDFSSKGNEKETDFIDCVAWRQTGEFVSKYFAKGRMACVSGSLQIRKWKDKDGNERRSAEIIADSVYFADSKNVAENGNSRPTAAPAGNPAYPVGNPAAPTAWATPAAAPASDYALINDDDGQLPF